MSENVPSSDAMAILDDAPCGLLHTDANGVIQWANTLFCTWVGYAAADIVGRRKIQDFFTIGGRIFHQTHWVPLMQMQHSVSEVKFDLVTAAGPTIPAVFNGIRRQRNGVIVHNLAVFVARDRDRYERELVHAGERLKAVAARSAELEVMANDRAVFAEQMMGIVSHDLRNPLATIDLSAMVLAASDAGANQQAALKRITGATSRAVRLIHDLLDFTQARLGNGLGIARVDMDLHAIMSESVDELRAAFPGRELVHRAEGAGRCEADPDRLMQLASNLVTNAITYGSVDSPVVITSRVAEDECAISVHNEGLPIDPETIGVLFEPMARGATGADGSRSVGLGLYIVREIAKAHNGSVTVTSSADKGTTFTATFSCRSASAPPG
ncbi:MAG: HAMP domain-containing sensor histidine kinase [Gemmatimonas sp.]